MNNDQFFETALKFLSRLELETLLLLALAAAVWLIGLNILMAKHHRQVEKPWQSESKATTFMFTDLTGKEWVILAILALLSLTIGAAAVNRQHRTEDTPNNTLQSTDLTPLRSIKSAPELGR